MKNFDVSGFKVELRVDDFFDIPSLYIAFGRVVNGEGGYFGACLDSLDDCLCGGFGAKPPFKLVVYSDSQASQMTDCLCELNWYRCWDKWVLEESDLTEEEIVDLGYPRASISCSKTSYFDRFIEVLRNRGVEVEVR